MGLATTAPGTAVALVTDMSSGLIDRFRSLPTARSAVLAGRTIADLVTQVIGARGGRRGRACHRLADAHLGSPTPPRRSAWRCCSATRFTWVGACLGMVLRSPEAAQQTGVRAVPAADLRLERRSSPPRDARLAAAGRGVEPDERAGRRQPRSCSATPIRRPRCSAWPMQHPELAVHRLVGGPADGLRPAGGAPVPAQGTLAQPQRDASRPSQAAWRRHALAGCVTPGAVRLPGSRAPLEGGDHAPGRCPAAHHGRAVPPTGERSRHATVPGAERAGFTVSVHDAALSA